jgi:hypothetical protein
MCDQGKYCHGKMCRNCKALFDAELDGDVEGQLFVKPSKEHPVKVHRCKTQANSRDNHQLQHKEYM